MPCARRRTRSRSGREARPAVSCSSASSEGRSSLGGERHELAEEHPVALEEQLGLLAACVISRLPCGSVITVPGRLERFCELGEVDVVRDLHRVRLLVAVDAEERLRHARRLRVARARRTREARAAAPRTAPRRRSARRSRSRGSGAGRRCPSATIRARAAATPPRSRSGCPAASRQSPAARRARSARTRQRGPRGWAYGASSWGRRSESAKRTRQGRSSRSSLRITTS